MQLMRLCHLILYLYYLAAATRFGGSITDADLLPRPYCVLAAGRVGQGKSSFEAEPHPAPPWSADPHL